MCMGIVPYFGVVKWYHPEKKGLFFEILGYPSCPGKIVIFFFLQYLENFLAKPLKSAGILFLKISFNE